jgi:hypothetical protein
MGVAKVGGGGGGGSGGAGGDWVVLPQGVWTSSRHTRIKMPQEFEAKDQKDKCCKLGFTQ